MGSDRMLCWGLGAVVLTAAGVMLAAFAAFVADDAFIVGRYSRNAAEGLGLVYNEGERVSALTSPLHALFMTVLAQVSDDPVALYRSLAPAITALGLGGALFIARTGLPASVLVLAFALGSPFTVLWSVGGLETPVLFALIALYAAILVRIWTEDAATDRQVFALAILCGLAFLTRFDSLLVTLPPMLALAAVSLRRPAVWLGAVLALGIAGAWLAFAWGYYGDILPTSAYVKLSSGSAPGIKSLFTALNFLLVTGLVLLWPLGKRRDASGGLGRALRVGVAISAILFFLYALQTSGKHMMFGYRAFVPYLPALGFILALRLEGRHLVAALLVLGINAAVAYSMTRTGMNVALLKSLPGIGMVTLEEATTTPTEYRTFIDITEARAGQVAAHWAATGQGGTPRIFLYTGGSGYWLRDFYVFETLISYRHRCADARRMVAASHYVQNIPSVPVNDAMQARIRDRADVGGAVTWVPGGDPLPRIRFAYGPSPQDIVFLPSKTRGSCRG